MLATWAQEQVIKYILTAESLGARPTSWYVALHTGDPGAGGSNEVESGVDSAYARQAVAFTAALDGTQWEADNDAEVAFDPAGSGADYTVTHATVHDALTTGNAILVAEFPSPIPVLEGGIVSIPVSQLLVLGGVL